MPPIHLLIKPASSLCNMRCAYCFYADVSQQRAVPSYGIMREETLEALVRKAMAYAEGHCTFAFQGGEPTLAGLPFFEKLISLQQQFNTRRLPIQNAIQTNGLLIDDEWAAFFHRNGFLVGLSLDGDASIHNALRPDAAGKGTYNRVMRAATTMRHHQCDYNILCVITKSVASHGTQVYNKLKRHRFLQFIPCLDGLGMSGSDFSVTVDLYLRFLKATFDAYYYDFMRGEYTSVRTFDNYVRILMGHPPESCAMQGICTCNLVVEGDGGLYPCDFYVLDTWRMGNIVDHTFEEVLQGPVAASFIESSLAKDVRCETCEWFMLCRGGCRRDRDPGMGQPLVLNRLCEAYRGFFAYSIDRMQKMAQVALRQREQTIS